jgi:hypothetical protein
MAHATAPALDANNHVAARDDFEIETFADTPFQTAVDVLLPDRNVKVGFLLGEEEGVDAAVQMGVLSDRERRRMLGCRYGKGK